MGEQLTIMTIASHITDLGSLTPKPVLSVTVPPGKLVHRREAQGEAGHPQRHPDAGPPGLRGNMLV